MARSRNAAIRCVHAGAAGPASAAARKGCNRMCVRARAIVPRAHGAFPPRDRLRGAAALGAARIADAPRGCSHTATSNHFAGALEA
jgi:hypothetical protein